MFFQKIPHISTLELQQLLMSDKHIELIDVREPFEFQNGHIAGAKNRPLGQITGFNSPKKVFVICQSGNRSRKATKILLKKGIDAVNVDGGMFAWHGPVKKGKS